jgi:hypothetical protein
MPDPQSYAGIPPIPPPKSGEEVYDSIMSQIELELTTEVYPTLEAKYKDETPQQKKERGERYAKAMEEYERQYKEYMLREEGDVRAFKRSAFRAVEDQVGGDDRAKLQNLESSFQSAA